MVRQGPLARLYASRRVSAGSGRGSHVNAVALPTERDITTSGRLLTNRPLVYSSFRFSYPTGGWTPQSGDPDPGACVTCVKPVPSTLTV